MSVVERLDGFQQRHRALGFPVAVTRKYSEDEGNRLAALMTYYGFLGFFPLAILFLGVITNLLSSRPKMRQELFDSLVPASIRHTVEEGFQNLPSAGPALVVGVLGLLLTGLGVANAVQSTLTHVFAVPFSKRSNVVVRYLRSFAILVMTLIGVLAIGASAVFSGMANQIPVVGAYVAPAASWLSLALLLLGGLRLVVGHVALSSAALGAGLAALGLILLASIAGWLVRWAVTNAGPVYGPLASVVGLFTVLFLICRLLVMCAEVASVHSEALWPRSLGTSDALPADRRALERAARAVERLEDQRNRAEFGVRQPSGNEGG